MGSTTTSEQEIAELIERWATAVRATDLDGALAAHTDDVVMFDVPPPEQGARGMEAYSSTWPQFFDWIRVGGTFEIVELEVVPGDDVAFAWALLRCGREAELQAHPERRLRLTIGLRREQGEWRIAHEHHSFTQTV